MTLEAAMIFKRSEILKDFSKLHKMIYGWPKSGKTTLAAQQIDDEGKEPLFIATEDGHHAIGVYVQKVTSWEGFSKLLDLLTKHMPVLRKQHSCIVVDLISDLDVMCAEHMCKKLNVVHLSDLDYGKGYALAKVEFQAKMRELMNIMPVTFIAHCTDKEIVWNNEKVKVQAPSISKASLEYLNGKVDVIAWMTPANNKKELPEITMKSTLTSIAGSRYPQLCKVFKMYPDEPRRTYKEIQDAFEGKKKAVVKSKEDQSSVTPDQHGADGDSVPSAIQ